jgi:LacI family transcriptional regulator
MAVSLALRNSPSVSAATRQRVQAIARSLGYAPDPALSTLMEKLRAASRARSAMTIALVTNESEGMTWRNIFTHQGYVEGARARAIDLGYQLEEFCLFSEGLTARRLNQVMVARGVDGVIILPLINRSSAVELELDWTRFSFATCGYSLQDPVLHRSCYAHLRGVMDVCRQLRSLGYRRPGLALDADQDRRAGHNWTAGYLAARHLAGEAGPGIPIWMPAGQTFDGFRAWFVEHRPDVVIHIGREGEILSWIRRCGRPVPAEVGYVFLDLWPTMTKISGLDQQARQIGAAAVDLVANGIRHNERGIPAHPKIVLTDGFWRSGATTRPQRESSRSRG